MTANDNLIKALKLLEPIGFDIDQLAGKHNQQARRVILSALHGHKQPASKCGLHKMRHDFYQAVQPDGNCLFNKQHDFRSKAALLIN